MFQRIKPLCQNGANKVKRAASMMWRRARSVRITRAQWGKMGSYAALALLLVILGMASSAYRSRQRAAEATEPSSCAAISSRADPAQPTPSPTPEPIQWVWPLEGDVVGAYSPDAPVWSKTLEQWQTHTGLDIAGAPGEAVYACMEGVIADAWTDRVWGNAIAIEHADGYRSFYAGLNTLRLVEVGASVSAGEIISAVGQSLPCEADLSAHIHFALTRDGAPVDFEALMDELDPD